MSAAPLQAAGPEAPWTGSAERLLRLVYRTSTASRQLRRLLADRVAPWQLSDHELLILWLCRRPGKSGKVQGDLASALGISPAQTSTLVEGLRKRGLLEQERSTLDRRRQMWRLSAAGDALLDNVGAAVAELASCFDAELSTDEQHLAEVISERLFELLQDRPRLRLFESGQTETLGQGASQ